MSYILQCSTCRQPMSWLRVIQTLVRMKGCVCCTIPAYVTLAGPGSIVKIVWYKSTNHSFIINTYSMWKNMSKTLCFFCILKLVNGALYELSLVSIFIKSTPSQKIQKKKNTRKNQNLYINKHHNTVYCIHVLI